MQSKKKIPVSIVIPVLNEAGSIVGLLDSLANQTVQPMEIIIVDGESTDSTVQKIGQFQKQHKNVHIETIIVPNSNRSEARNVGIKHATSEILALTDAGCLPKTDWLEKLTEPFITDKKTEVVAGFYDPAPQNVWQEVVANATSTRTWNFDAKTFLPSSRSIAFTKSIWKKVKGYPEELDTCEDLVFAEKLKKSAKHWTVRQDAQVIWHQETSLSAVRDKIFHYALGDLQAGYERHIRKIYSAMWRVFMLFAIAFPLLYVTFPVVRILGIGVGMLYILGVWYKHRRSLRWPQAWLYTVIIQFCVDTSLVQALIYHQLKKTVKS